MSDIYESMATYHKMDLKSFHNSGADKSMLRNCCIFAAFDIINQHLTLYWISNQFYSEIIWGMANHRILSHFCLRYITDCARVTEYTLQYDDKILEYLSLELSIINFRLSFFSFFFKLAVMLQLLEIYEHTILLTYTSRTYSWRRVALW